MSGEVVALQPRWSAAPCFVVDDVVATANYYRDKLGFVYDRLWGEPPAFCMVCRRGVVVMLSQLERTGVMRPNRLVDPEGAAWDAYIWIDNADALAAEFKSKGVKTRLARGPGAHPMSGSFARIISPRSLPPEDRSTTTPQPIGLQS